MVCLALGVSFAGADWVERLAQARWFAGLEPQVEDLVVSGGISAGSWIAPSVQPGDWNLIQAETEAFAARAVLPRAVLATIAVPSTAEPSDLAVVLGLVGALRQHRDPGGYRISVLATLEAGLSDAADLVCGLQGRGAFVVQAGPGARGDHLHHFPLRAAIVPPLGRRLVCVDLADHLASWRAGGVATLHVIPSSPKQAMRVVPQLVAAGAADGRVCGLNLLAHIDPSSPGDHLAELDRLTALCRSSFLASGDNEVVTTASRLDSVTGTADLLLIHQ